MKGAVDGWGKRVTATIIPIKAIDGLRNARSSITNNMERAKIAGKLGLAQTSKEALELVEKAILFCEEAQKKKLD